MIRLVLFLFWYKPHDATWHLPLIGRCTNHHSSSWRSVACEPVDSVPLTGRSSLIGTVLGIPSVLWIIWMQMHPILWSSWVNAWWFGVPTRRCCFVFFRMQLSWSSFGDSLGGGWENGKTKNLLVLFVLKHDWKMDFLWFSYAKSDEDWVYPNPRRICYISMKHFPKNPGAKK